MSSRPSSSPASPEASRTGLRYRWPTLVALPGLIAFLGAASISPLIAVFLSDSFGLSGGRGAPWSWAFAVIGLLGFWSAKFISSRGFSMRISSAILVLLALVMIGLWIAVQPNYDLKPLLRDPASLVHENGYLIPPIFLGLGAWYQGIRYDYDPGLFSPEEVRSHVQRAWILLAAGIVIAAMIGGGMGDAGISAAAIAVPVAMACSAGAVAAAETNNTRFLASRRGSSAPGWDRWARLFGGIVVISLIVTLIAAILLGPDSLAFVKDGLGTMFRALGTVLYYGLFAIVYVIYWIVRFVAWIVNSIFGDVFAPMEMPKFEQQGQQEQQQYEVEEGDGFGHATLLRWIALGIALVIVAIIIFRLNRSRQRGSDDPDVEEERQSVFSAKLARQQLRDLFRRKPKAERPHRLDLDVPPSSVRESMLYLQVLATRQHVGRRPGETPADFTTRLDHLWPGLADPLGVIRDRYEHVRYGETADDHAAVVAAWQRIWSARKDVAIPLESSE
ncbi:MAG TPA: DUF4129 domain-containing protein [Thermomicrobiales bacterium]|nr:DUF4129 domain-containing protein [Thermomicrobiales bacterium]